MYSRKTLTALAILALVAACHSSPKTAPAPTPAPPGSGTAAAPAQRPATPPAAGRGATPPPVAGPPMAAGGPPGGGPPGGRGGPPGGGRGARLTADSTGILRAAQLQAMTTTIAGHENEPAEVVFTNVTVLKGITAGQLLRNMDSYGRALTLQCTGCHVAGDYAADTRPNKPRARMMINMVTAINADQMPKLDPANPPRIGCMTCHHGNQSPNQSLDAALQKANEAAAAGGATPAPPPPGGRGGGRGGGGR